MKKKMDKDIEAYKTIGEVSKILTNTFKESKSISTHTIRFWEKEFKQIRPKIFNGSRRYYDIKSIELLKKVHFLLKVEGMTIKGVKRILENKESLKLDEMSNNPIKTINLKMKLTKISNIIKNLKYKK
ncbi:MAG: MerR family transcriptional regulator [Candidatus Pelagibacter sp.]|tara:strand:+ start:113 stop:496 length:384 start_codon:yes stop_codon:yes gene_type:complete